MTSILLSIVCKPNCARIASERARLQYLVETRQESPEKRRSDEKEEDAEDLEHPSKQDCSRSKFILAYYPVNPYHISNGSLSSKKR